MRYLIETYGCQMNKAESSALESMFLERGWQPIEAIDQKPKKATLGTDRDSRTESRPKASTEAIGADLVIINTCSVRATAETRAWGRIDHYAAIKRERAITAQAAGNSDGRFTLVVTGCMAERMKREIKSRQPAVDYVVGTFQKQAFGLVLDAVEQGKRLEDIDESPAFVFARSYYEPGSFRSFVPIMHGCDNFCTYCIVPYIRGREVSRSPGAIIEEIFALADSGVREITLLGQNVNSYRWKPAGAGKHDTSGSTKSLEGIGWSDERLADCDDEEMDFPGLLRLVSAKLRERASLNGGIRWIRFLTSHPKDLSEDVIRVLAEDPLFCKHVHLCVQSGSDAILGAMNRRYTRDDYLSLVDRMRASIPDLSLSTDILVGFPGETEEDLEWTLDLMRRVGYVYAYMYHFNPREGTPAAAMPGRVPDSVKRDRLTRVIELQKAQTRALMRSRIGDIDDVLIEGPSRRKSSEVLARTQRDEMVVFPAESSRIGSFARVRLLSLAGNTFKAEEVAV